MTIQDLLQEIYDAGFTDPAIAKAISDSGHKISQPVIFRLRKGINKKISYERYKKIVDVHKKLINGSKEAA